MANNSGLIIAGSHQGLSQINHSVNTSLEEDMPVAFNITQVLKYGSNQKFAVRVKVIQSA